MAKPPTRQLPGLRMSRMRNGSTAVDARLRRVLHPVQRAQPSRPSPRTRHPILTPPFISIDPGLTGMGWAYWTDKKAPDAVGVIYGKAKDDTLSARCHELVELLEIRPELIRSRFAPHLSAILELPQQMGSAAGIAAQSGSVYKLAFLVGYLACALFPAEVHVVTPQDWKGQLPKSVVQHRVQRDLGAARCRKLNIRTHAWDAVGLGLWATGRWRK